MNRIQFRAIALKIREAIADAKAGKRPGWELVYDLAHQLRLAAVGYGDQRTDWYATAVACYAQRCSGGQRKVA